MMCGTATLAAFQLPVRLTSTITCQRSLGISWASIGTGADARLGGDDVEPPELGDAVVDDLLERRVVAHVGLAAMIRRSSASTWRTVSSRSAGVEGG